MRIELHDPPSAEAERLLDLAPAILAGPRGDWLRSLIIAPYTQLTFGSFRLQAHLFGLLHTSPISRGGHLLGMNGAVLFLLALAARVHPGLGLGLGLLLAVWWTAVALPLGLWGWALFNLLALGVYGAGAWLLRELPASQLALGWAASVAVVALSHTAEPDLPPRAGEPDRWVPLLGWIGEPGVPAAQRARRILRVVVLVPLGFANEAWASPRLAPYTLLWLLMGMGYAPELRSGIMGRVRAAQATGNPALDFIGGGGGQVLPPRGERQLA